ncbi:methyltransferase domain-containing protein [Altererythrobacter aurantiacus]|uniref:Methyltransferase domain-containing protein n=1 Tax=Parapontixanthobacter aurantiacus TaxID=1463599 RepID=A0A844ZDT5_9SPHN|nr:methyltransferase domain-containing protein [Parapontixanthobacter aurantiacus]MXO85412.1 methyltransferase domain-containing protein [Parapontixanthobacter aurantiacus]
MNRLSVLCLVLGLGLVTGCERVGEQGDRPETALAFPLPDRPVSNLGANRFSTETARDSVNEAQKVMDLAAISEGMTVADIGAGEGYYTVRLAERVGESGRVLAQDIDRNALSALGERVSRERLDNVSIKPGAPDDPRLPENSFDRIFLVHMYHEVAEPYAFLWRLWPALREGGQVIVVDVDRPTDQHGIDPLLLSCEFREVGFELVQFRDEPELAGYYAKFERAAKRAAPADIQPCRGSSNDTNRAAS